MIKRMIFMSVLAAVRLFSKAQTIDLVDAPAIGDQITYVLLDGDPILTPGTGQTWVLTGAIEDEPGTISFVPVAGAPGAMDFPMATLAAQQDPWPAAAFFKVSSSGLELLGQHDPPGPSAVNVDTDLWLPYPCSLGTTWTEGYTMVDTESGDTLDHVAPSLWVADGTGSLTGQAGTLSGVLKCRTTRSSTTIISGDTATVSTVIDRLWKPGYPMYVAQVRRSTYTMPGQDPFTVSTVEVVDELAVGMEVDRLSEIGIRVFPNPANNEVGVVFSAEGPVTINVLDAKGRQVITTGVGAGAPGIRRADLALEELPAGRYLVRLIDAQGHQTSRAFVHE